MSDNQNRPAAPQTGATATAQIISVGGASEDITMFQLAARWAEKFAPSNGDSLADMLKRYRLAYEFLDAVAHGNKPPEL
ncbi:MAG: hypothetical protein IT307_10865 [Chloroflexi bacterium]|nr:hypothetical protein [Chloroflexota bacterium]